MVPAHIFISHVCYNMNKVLVGRLFFMGLLNFCMYEKNFLIFATYSIVLHLMLASVKL